MKFEDIDGESWPIAEPGDFDTEDGDEKFFIMEEENGDGCFAYGHIDPVEFIAEVCRYLVHTIGEDGFDELYVEDVRHTYARFIDKYAEQFTWDGVTAETAHAFPLTYVMF